MKTRTRLALLLGLLLAEFGAPAQEARPASGAARAAKPTVSDADERAEYSALTRTELELEAQVKLLAELEEQHRQRSGDAARSGPTGKPQWEADLAQELANRRTAMLGQLAGATQRRLAFEAVHPGLAGAALVGGALAGGRSLNPDESAFLTRLDQRLLKVRQELIATSEASRGLYGELQTNATQEAVGRISGLLEEIARQARQWEREASDLELKKLEFRALRK